MHPQGISANTFAVCLKNQASFSGENNAKLVVICIILLKSSSNSSYGTCMLLTDRDCKNKLKIYQILIVSSSVKLVPRSHRARMCFLFSALQHSS